MRKLALIFTLALALFSFGCSQDAKQKPAPTPEPAPAAPAKVAPVSAEVAVMHTSAGDMIFEFWPDVAPKTVENFKKLARSGFYEHTAFHRIMKGFMIQGGCPNTKPGASGKPGTGDPGYKIKAEFNYKAHVRGVLSMARSGHPDSAGCQFFICTARAPGLDEQYTAFGKLVAGDDILEKISSVPTTYNEQREKSVPTERIEITGIEIVPAASIQK